MQRTFLWIASAMMCTAALCPAKTAGSIDGVAARSNDGKLTLRQIEAAAADAQAQADTLQHAAMDTRLSRETHARLLTRMSEDINRIGEEIKTMEAEQESLPTWERQALATTAPLLKDAADKADLAILFLNENAPYLWKNGTYERYNGQIEADCAKAVKELQTYRRLAQTTQREQHLRELLVRGS